MPVDALLGLQWGDEGKGKIVDYLAERYQLIVRFGGGPNAGHTIENHLGKLVLNQLPSGILYTHTLNLLGAGMVIDIPKLLLEIAKVQNMGIKTTGRVLIAREAHLILPTHIKLDVQAEESSAQNIGSTKRGIGPTYVDKVGRKGLRVGDIFEGNFRSTLRNLLSFHATKLPQKTFISDWLIQVDAFKELVASGAIRIVESVGYLHDHLRAGSSILAEGAQGALLDINFGTYPYVTSSSTVSGGICTGLGIPPQAINKVIGITKAYTTRVGNGPFPTELSCETGTRLQVLGGEKGATTGRLRRCGWLDLPLLAQAIKLTGTTELVVTKLDILKQFAEYKICVAYEQKGKLLNEFPMYLDHVTPVYQSYNHDTPLREVMMEHLRELGCRDVRIKYESNGPHREEITVYA